MRIYNNNLYGVAYTTPMEDCKTRKPTEQEKAFIEENWEELKRQVTKNGRYMIIHSVIVMCFFLFSLYFAAFYREVSLYCLCTLGFIIFGVESYFRITTARGLFRLAEHKEYEVTIFVCRGACAELGRYKKNEQIYYLKTEIGQQIRYSCMLGLGNINFRDEGFIIVDNGAVALLPVDKVVMRKFMQEHH
ncbi:MAG: hypothetical protein VZR06_11485 [Butyrivibrio sp.]|nr:hypothetical protein [Butyrivibrio sp.]